MKAITLTQPYATLVAIGAKRIETRSWRTNYRGPLAVHAAKGPGEYGWPQLNHICRKTEPFKGVLKLTDHPAKVLPLGVVVATCTLVDCVPTDRYTTIEIGDERWTVPPGNMSNEYEFGDYTPGRFAWLLANVRLLSEPLPARGALGLWEWPLP